MGDYDVAFLWLLVVCLYVVMVLRTDNDAPMPMIVKCGAKSEAFASVAIKLKEATTNNVHLRWIFRIFGNKDIFLRLIFSCVLDVNAYCLADGQQKETVNKTQTNNQTRAIQHTIEQYSDIIRNIQMFRHTKILISEQNNQN